MKDIWKDFRPTVNEATLRPRTVLPPSSSFIGRAETLVLRTISLPATKKLFIAIGSVAAVALLREPFLSIFDMPTGSYPLALFYMVVLVVSTFLGPMAGMIAGLASVLYATIFVIHPLGSISVATAYTQFGVLNFVLYCLTVAAVIGLLHRTMQHLKSSEHLRDLLFMEFRHRSRNDLNSLYSLITIRSKEVQDPVAKAHMQAAARHALTLAKVYKRLESHHYLGGSVTIDTKEFVEGLFQDLFSAHAGNKRISWKIFAASHQLGFERAIQLGLVMNEMITNCVKYAFPEPRTGMITVLFKRDASDLVLEITDNGVGMQAAVVGDGTTGSGIGSRILSGVAKQLNGSLSRGPGPGGIGTTARLRFRME